jgi:hypothetical protein
MYVYGKSRVASRRNARASAGALQTRIHTRIVRCWPELNMQKRVCSAIKGVNKLRYVCPPLRVRWSPADISCTAVPAFSLSRSLKRLIHGPLCLLSVTHYMRESTHRVFYELSLDALSQIGHTLYVCVQ